MNTNENTGLFFETLNEEQKKKVIDKVDKIIKEAPEAHVRHELIEEVARGMYRLLNG